MKNQSEYIDIGNGQGDTIKRGRVPYYPLSKGIEIAKIVKDNGGNASPVPRSVLAQHLHCSQSSVTLDQMTGTAKTFGLICGRGVYRLTELGKRFFFPTSPNEAAEALLKAVSCPTVYEELIKKFDGNQLPQPGNLSNLLERDYKVSGSWKQRIAGIFIAAMNDVGAIDEGDFLRYEAAVHRTKGDSVLKTHGDKQENPPPPPLPETQSQRDDLSDENGNKNQGYKEFRLPLDGDGDRWVSVKGPVAVTRKELDRICKWLEFQLIVENETKENG